MKRLSFLRRVQNSQVFWPLVAWVVILLFNLIVDPSFFKLGILSDPTYGKHLYGNIIDIFNNGAPLILVSIGMTLVIATAGVDLSVGAVIAISAAMGAVLINPALGNRLISNEILTRNATNTPLTIIILADLAAGTVCGLWNGLIISRGRMQPMVATLILIHRLGGRQRDIGLLLRHLRIERQDHSLCFLRIMCRDRLHDTQFLRPQRGWK
ncbi:MAG: hypothetical protein P8Z42_07630 [Anaerolineales bacterium]